MIPPSGGARPGDWLRACLVPGLFVLGAAVRGLRFGGRFHLWSHWDETQLAVPALRIFDGSFPVNAGPEYFGAAPSYLLAVWFAVVGTSTWALDLFAYAIGLLILGTGYLVGRRLLDRRAALLALAVLAAPPLLLTQWSVTAAPNHPTVLVLGNLCLLTTHTLFFRARGRARTILALGLLAGLGWWTDPLILVYLMPFTVLAVRTGLAWQARVWLFPAGLILGGLPVWLYELRYFPSARWYLLGAGTVEVAPLGERVRAVAVEFVPQVLGFLPAGAPRWLFPFLVTSLGLWLAAVAWAAIRDRRELVWLVGLDREPGRGAVMLWILAGTNIALVLVTARFTSGYYLLPLYAALPCWMGETLDRLWRRRRLLGVAALSVLLASNLWLNWHDTLGTRRPSDRRWAHVRRGLAPLLEWLDAHGIRRVYWVEAAGLVPYEVTYLATGRLVAADLWRETVVTHGRLVDAAEHPPVVASGRVANSLRAELQSLGLAVSETRVGASVVVETTPSFATGFVPLRRDGWTVTASLRGAEAGRLLDGDAASGWSTGTAQAPGQWVAVDLGREARVTRVDLLAVDWQEVPAGFRVEVSRDGQHWNTVSAVPDYWGPVFFSEHHAFLRVRRGRVQAIFPPVPARHVRVVQTGRADGQEWSARELFVYEPGGPRPPIPRAGDVTAGLRREGVWYVYANPWLSAWVSVESRGAIEALESNLNLNDHSQREPAPEVLVPVRLEVGRGILIGSDADTVGMRAMLAGQGVPVREAAAGPYRLLAFEPGPAWRRLDRRGWRASASASPERARRAIDGRRHTAWTAGGGVGPAPTFTLDLGSLHRLRRLEVRPGVPGRDLRLWGSHDGVTWEPIQPLHWAGVLYWTGSELLRNGAPAWAVTFAPIELRYLRLAPADPMGEASLSIAEIEGFE